MLQTQAIKSNALSILKRVMNMKEFSTFSLVGGTTLALKYGHRMSVDLDIFSYENLTRDKSRNKALKEMTDLVVRVTLPAEPVRDIKTERHARVGISATNHKND